MHFKGISVGFVAFALWSGFNSPAEALDCVCTATLRGGVNESLYLRWWAEYNVGAQGIRFGSIQSSVRFRGAASCDPATRKIQVFRGFRTLARLGAIDYGVAMGNEENGRWSGFSRIDNETITIPVVRSGEHDLRTPRQGERTDDSVELVCHSTEQVSREQSVRESDEDLQVHAGRSTRRSAQPAHSDSDPTL